MFFMVSPLREFLFVYDIKRFVFYHSITVIFMNTIFDEGENSFFAPPLLFPYFHEMRSCGKINRRNAFSVPKLGEINVVYLLGKYQLPSLHLAVVFTPCRMLRLKVDGDNVKLNLQLFIDVCLSLFQQLKACSLACLPARCFCYIRVNNSEEILGKFLLF